MNKLSNETKNQPLHKPAVGGSFFIDNLVKETFQSVMNPVKLSNEEKANSRKELIASFEEWKNSPETNSQQKLAINKIQDICREQINSLVG